MSAFQGFDRKLNLVENTEDRNVLNNLGGAPIADDIVLFLNNLRNTSELVVTSTEIDGSFIRFDANIRSFVYIDGTKIKVDGADYFVGDSNTINEFRLYSDEALTNLVEEPPEGTYVRSDAVIFNDVQNLVRNRQLVIEDVSLSQIGDSDDEFLQIENVYGSFIRTYDEVRRGFLSNLSSYINSIDTELDFFELRRLNSLNSLADFDSDNDLSLSGNIIVSDPDGINDTEVSTTVGPGIFILDPDTGETNRIFSSNENVWSEDANNLIADTREISVGTFVFDEGVRILRKNNQPTITTEIDVVTEYTHFVKIIVNGEEYSLCLK